MISRIPIKCLACQSQLTARVQVGHEIDQLISSVCPSCYTPFKLRLLLNNPPHVNVEFQENCEPTALDAPSGTIVNIGSGFVIPRSKKNDDLYFPSMGMPKPTQEELMEQVPEGWDRERDGPLVLDTVVALGGMHHARDTWKKLRNAYRFFRTGQDGRCKVALRQILHHDLPDEELTIEEGLVTFVVKFLKPCGERDIKALLSEVGKINQLQEHDMGRLLDDFMPKRWERMDHKIEVLDQFFRGYDDFNQVLLYVRRKIELPDDPYAPSTNFEHTRMYYGEAFEVLGSDIDLLAAFNNILSARPFDKLASINLEKYRNSDKGRRKDTFATNAVFSSLVEEYSNTLRNATHHRWLTLSHDRSLLRYRNGGNGEQITLSYAEYLWQCCRITRQIALLMVLEAIVFKENE